MRKSAPVFGKRNNACTNRLRHRLPMTSSTQTKKTPILPEIWLKAAMLGSLWASVEIILGSFLHNLHVPLSGTFLASLGVILMINGYKLWPEKGLFWRTALVTAAMKSISPSAVIFGPMVGIFMEGLILETGLRIFRGRWLGFVIGGALAVSWSLFQKIFVLLLTYGPDFVTLYEQLYFMATKSLGIQRSVPIDLVKAIFFLDLSFGAIVAALALRTSSAQKSVLYSPKSFEPSKSAEELLSVSDSQVYSIPLFLLNLTILVGGLYFLSHASLLFGGAAILIYVISNILRYSKSMRRLKNPQLWIQLFAIMGLSGLLLGGWDSAAALISGMQIGIAMAIRALLVIFTLSALSIEIRNPKIMNWFTRNGMGVLFESLSLSFEVLPRLMQLVARKKRFWRHPFLTLNELLGALEILRREHIPEPARVIILTGDQGSGKTHLIKDILDSPRMKGITFSGFYTEGTWVDGERDHYHVVDFTNDTKALLCERSGPVSEIQAGPFYFRQQGIDFGCKVLSSSPSNVNNHIVIIDEIGHLELRDTGWGQCMGGLIARNQPMIWTVRPSLVDAVIKKWNFQFYLIDIKSTDSEDIFDKIESFFA